MRKLRTRSFRFLAAIMTMVVAVFLLSCCCLQGQSSSTFRMQTAAMLFKASSPVSCAHCPSQKPNTPSHSCCSKMTPMVEVKSLDFIPFKMVDLWQNLQVIKVSALSENYFRLIESPPEIISDLTCRHSILRI